VRAPSPRLREGPGAATSGRVGGAGRVRLAQVMGSAALGGAEAFYERLVPALAAAGETVLAVTRRDPGRRARLCAAGVEPIELPFGNHFDFATRPRLAALLEGFRPEVVVAWMNRAAGYAGAVKRRGAAWTLVGRLGGYYDLRHYRHCDHLVGNTRDLRAWLVRLGWPEDRAHVVPNFAQDFAGVAPAALPPAPAGARRLLALGRLHPNKGFDVLLRALTLLPPGAAHLSLAGEGPERERLARLARELGVADRVAFLGWREDAGALLAACDALVCPSRHEPLGNVVLEAWSAARPVVAAAAQGPTELIRDGETGLLVPTEAPEALAAAVAGLLADPARAAALAAAGRAEFERAHAEAPVLARWREFLRAVAPSAAPPAPVPAPRTAVPA
jgi:glycosyltransferase involved in cell wall biosynthesis